MDGEMAPSKISPVRFYSSTTWVGDVAQLVEHRTGTPLTQIRFPGAAKDFSFSPGVDFQCMLSSGVRTTPYVMACINVCAHVIAALVHRWIMETLKTPSTHRRLGSATQSQPAFPWKNDLYFPWEKSHMGQYSCKKKLSSVTQIISAYSNKPSINYS